VKLRAIARALDAQREQNEFQRWMIASAIICILHLMATLAVLNWPKRHQFASDAPPAILIELSPVPVAPDSQHRDVAPGPEMIESQPSQQQKQNLKPEEKAPVPDLPEKPAEVQLPAPAPEKQEQQKQEPQKAQQQKKEQPQKAAPQTTAAPKLNLKKSDRQAAPAAGSTAESQAAVATWRGAVSAHLNRFKRSLPGAVGTAVVSFSVDSGGRVMGARLVTSSGNSAADADAVAMVLRASPVPRPPANLANGGAIPVAVPVRYLR
jgi:protein TonB